ncbi:MAG: hypothetical protein WCO56_02325 [Verrucomicrobiota bacterium]
MAWFSANAGTTPEARPAKITAAEGSNALARVVVVQDQRATQTFNPQPAVVDAMVARGITKLTGLATPAVAWRSLFTTQDVVGIKVYTAPGPTSGTRPAVVSAVVRSLISAGLKPAQIVIWDKRGEDLRRAGFVTLAETLGVRAAGALESGYDEKVFYENAVTGKPVWGDLEFGKPEPVGRKSFMTKLVTHELTKIISIAPLVNHYEAGVTGHLFSLAMGSMDNTIRFEQERTLLADPVPEIFGIEALYDRVVLHITDALLCQYLGENQSLLHYSTVLNQLRFSRDAVALDTLSLQELGRQRGRMGMKNSTVQFDIYPNASLMQLGTTNLNHIKVELVTP